MEKFETILVFDSKADKSVSVDIDLTGIFDEGELEFFFDETVTNCHGLKTKENSRHYCE